MKKKNRRKIKDFDRDFDEGKESINFQNGVLTEGLSKIVRLPPLSVPGWVAIEIERIAKIQANSKASVIRQLLVEAIQSMKKAA